MILIQKPETTLLNFKCQLHKLINKGFKIAAYSGNPKENNLLTCANMTYNDIDYIIAENPENLDMFSLEGIPIVPMGELKIIPPDYMVILALNCKKIMEDCRNFGYTGSFIIPIPEFTICN